MNKMPDIGAHVIYVSSNNPERTVTGTVTFQYPTYRFHAAGKRVDVPDAVEIKVDSIPEWWPYLSTDLFCPGIDEIELIKE